MEDVMGNRIVFADRAEVTMYAPEIERVLAAIAFFMSSDPVKWMKNCWVSDMSSMSDFNLTEQDVTKISESLGVPIGEDDLLWKIAQAIHEREN